MSLDISLTKVMPCGVFNINITHNLTQMAEEAEIYQYVWRPEELGITHARELIEPLSAGLLRLLTDPERFKKFNPHNGWGSLQAYLHACIEHPDAEISVSR